MDGPAASAGARRRGRPRAAAIRAAAATAAACAERLSRAEAAAFNPSWRADPIHWPTLSSAQAKRVQAVLNRYRVLTSEDYRWLGIKKQQLVRAIITRRAITNTFIYGLSECCTAVHHGACWAVLVEAHVMPRSIILPIVEECVFSNTPMVCLTDLRNVNASNFGIYTGCLGIKKGCLPELRKQILSISNAYKAIQAKLRNAMPKPPPENQAPGEVAVQNLFDLNPEEKPGEAKKRGREGANPEVAGEPSGKMQRPPSPVSTFRMVLKKGSRKSERRAVLDIDKKKVVVLPD